ncbi:MAG: LPS assembly lipoprotein LptE [Planctomycetota bacterium]
MRVGTLARCQCHPLLLLVILVLPGCASYRIGSQALYAPDVTTVYVPMISSTSFRRDLGERLTEAVVKEIELKTPFKVVGTPDADSVLSARLVTDTKTVLYENQNDDPRVTELGLFAEVAWVNRRRQPIVPGQTLPIPPALVPFTQTATLIPEGGQSLAGEQQKAIQRLAEQIVGTMEEPW